MRATANLALLALATQSTNAIFCFVKEKKCLPGVGLSLDKDELSGLLGITTTKSATVTGTATQTASGSPTPAMDAAVPTPEADESEPIGAGFLEDILPMRKVPQAPPASPPAAETPAASVAAAASPAPTTVALYGQCGAGTKGQWSGPTTCSEGTCQASQDYYSCLPGVPPAPAAPPAPLNQAAPAGPMDFAAPPSIVPGWIRELIPREASLQAPAPPAYDVPVYHGEVSSASFRSEAPVTSAYPSNVAGVTLTTIRYGTVIPTLTVSHSTASHKSSAPYKVIHTITSPQPSAPQETSGVIILTTTVDVWVPAPTTLSTSILAAYTTIERPSAVPVSPIYPAPKNRTDNVVPFPTATRPKPTIYVVPMPANSTQTPEAYMGAATTISLNLWFAVGAGMVAMMAF